MGEQSVGGLVGISQVGDVDSSFWDVDTSGQMSSPGTLESLGKTTLEMQDANTFIEAGWNFDRPIWTVADQNYPKLAWSDVNCSEGTINDHVFEIVVVTAQYLGSPIDPNDTEYAFGLEVRTDDCVERVEFTAPSGFTSEIPRLPWYVDVDMPIEIPGATIDATWEYITNKSAYEWDFEAYFDNPDGLQTFGDGMYTITVHYANGRQEQTEAWFGVPSTDTPIPQLTRAPAFTSFSHGDTLTSPVTFRWETCPNANSAWMDLDSDTESFYLQFTFAGDASELMQPIDLVPDSWEADLACDIIYDTKNADGVAVRVGRSNEVTYEFTVGP